ncbi:hypothetical protein [Streptomyces sp. NPDC005407]|uniref:hypothetical protein n=1 Tax=Streptomyces sp. NPDC005407 TaxID=3155340 RepID=UPI0033BD30CD
MIAVVYFAVCYPLSQLLLWLERRIRAGAPLPLRRRKRLAAGSAAEIVTSREVALRRSTSMVFVPGRIDTQYLVPPTEQQVKEHPAYTYFRPYMTGARSLLLDEGSPV